MFKRGVGAAPKEEQAPEALSGSAETLARRAPLIWISSVYHLYVLYTKIY